MLKTREISERYLNQISPRHLMNVCTEHFYTQMVTLFYLHTCFLSSPLFLFFSFLILLSLCFKFIHEQTVWCYSFLPNKKNKCSRCDRCCQKLDMKGRRGLIIIHRVLNCGLSPSGICLLSTTKKKNNLPKKKKE